MKKVTAEEIIQTLQQRGTEQFRKIFTRHGAKRCFGVKMADLAFLKKKIGINHVLAQELYKTGMFEAMYLAGLIADSTTMKKEEIELWCKQASCCAVSEYTIPDLAVASKYVAELAKSWIESKEEHVAASGWATISRLMSDTKKNIFTGQEIDALIDRIVVTIHDALPRVRYTMNGCLISIGIYQDTFLEKALESAEKIGKVVVPMPGTSCKIPFAPDYIKKARARK